MTLLIDGDDGTNLNKQEIAAALQHPDFRDKRREAKHRRFGSVIPVESDLKEMSMHQNIKERMEVIGSDGAAVAPSTASGQRDQADQRLGQEHIISSRSIGWPTSTATSISPRRRAT